MAPLLARLGLGRSGFGFGKKSGGSSGPFSATGGNIADALAPGNGYKYHTFGSPGSFISNSPGTIDSDYRGEICVIMINHGPRSIEFKKGDRIAQLVLSKVERIEWLPVDSLSGTKRGEKGFGSTGL